MITPVCFNVINYDIQLQLQGFCSSKSSYVMFFGHVLLQNITVSKSKSCDSYSSRKPNNRKPRLQFTPPDQNWTTEDDELWWVSISAAVFGRQGCWWQQHERMDPSCLISTAQAGGVCAGKLWGIFSWHTFAPLVDRWITAFLTTVHLFIRS